MIKRMFYTVGEGVEALGGDHQLVMELVEFHGLRAYYRFDGCRAESQMDHEDFLDSLACSGSHELARWSYWKHKKGEEEDDGLFDGHYFLTGWFELCERTTSRVLSGRSDTEPSANSYKNGARLGGFHQISQPVFTESARFMVKDIDRLAARIAEGKSPAPTASDMSGGKAEKPVATRTRNNLLRVIAALCKESKVDLESARATTQVRQVLDNAGFKSPDDKSLRDFLREAAAQEPEVITALVPVIAARPKAK